MTTLGLPPRQQQILEVLRQSVRERGFAPSIRELGDAIGLASTASVHYHLVALEKAGLIRRVCPGSARLEIIGGVN